MHQLRPVPTLAPRPLARPFTPSIAHRLRLPPPLAGGPDTLVALGADFLLFLGAIVLVVPVFKSANLSPVLGYLFAGLVMGQLGLFRNVEEIEKLSELGILFLLFEMGLELSFDKLRALAKYAFGLGSLQMAVTTAAFMAVSLPPGEGIMTKLLELGVRAPPSLAEIKTVDEAIVIAVALSLSSSAFVLQLLKERGELESKFGNATLGILLFQDIATVPFLVLLPLIEGRGGGLDGLGGAALLSQLAPTALKTFGGIGLVLLGGRTFLRRVFEVVASARSEETFIALCLLSVTGASLLTQRLGFSDTLGAFVSGVLLSETNFKAQVEADIQPFRGLLLGLFFVTTGASLDLALLIREWPTVLLLLVGLLSLKATLISFIGPSVGLTKEESIRTGFVLSQGGEFAFVLLALASQLNVLPADLNKLLIIVVVLSMAATPLLTEAGKQVAEYIAAKDGAELSRGTEGFNIEDPVLICGFGGVGQAVANMLEALAIPYVAFDLTVARVQAAQETGFNVLYGDGSRKKVLHAAGIDRPRAVVVGYTARQRAVSAVDSLKNAFPSVPIIVRAIDLVHAAELEEAGASYVVSAETEAGLTVGSRVAQDLGVAPETVRLLTKALRDDMEARTHELAAMAQGKLDTGNGRAIIPASSSASSSSATGDEHSIAAGGKKNSLGITATNGTGNATAPVMRSVYKFDSANTAWNLIEASVSNSATESLATGVSMDDPSQGLLANIGATLLTAMGSGTTDEYDDDSDGGIDVGVSNVHGSIEASTSSGSSNGSFVDRVEADEIQGNASDSSAMEGGDGSSTSITTLITGSGERIVVPDGSLECPVDWESEESSVQ